MKRIVMMMLVLGLGMSGRAQASDAGDLIFPVDLFNQTRAELIYQSVQRKLDTDEKFKADVYTLRIHTDVGQYASLDFDLGGISPRGGDMEFYGGVGLRFLAYDGEDLRISPFAQLHYAPGIETKAAKYDDLLDGEIGILFAKKFKLDDALVVMPYAGPALSIIRLSGDVDADEDEPFGAVAGVSLLMPGNNTFRIEAQFFERVGVSAAAGIAF